IGRRRTIISLHAFSAGMLTYPWTVCRDGIIAAVIFLMVQVAWCATPIYLSEVFPLALYESIVESYTKICNLC
ncbi:hypothetical protein V1519DRAFT_359979, partial [Lipomyces tetrasporus]